MFTLGTLFEAALLLINSIAILNEERFLKKGMIIRTRLKVMIFKERTPSGLGQ